VQLQKKAGGLFGRHHRQRGWRGLRQAHRAHAAGRRIAFFGATTGNPPGIDLRKCFFRQISILGTTMGSPADFHGMQQFVEMHRLAPVVDRVFPLAETEVAFRHMEAAAQFGKIGLSM